MLGVFSKWGQIDARLGHQTPAGGNPQVYDRRSHGYCGMPDGPSGKWPGSRREGSSGHATADESDFAFGPESAYSLASPEIKIHYRLQRDKQTGVVSLASAVTSPKTIAIAWETAFGPMPENPVLVQLTFIVNVHTEKVPGTFTTTAPVSPQNGQWSADISDMVNRLIVEINSTLSPNYDPYTMSFPLDTDATVKAIPVQRNPANSVLRPSSKGRLRI